MVVACQFSADSQPKSIGYRSEGWQFSLHSSNEPGELSQ